MDDSSSYRLEISGLEESGEPNEPARAGPAGARPWVGVQFDCCGVYLRIYRRPADTAYQGCCPRCGRKVVMRVGPGGTDARFFVAQ